MQPPDHHSDTHPTEPPGPAGIYGICTCAHMYYDSVHLFSFAFIHQLTLSFFSDQRLKHWEESAPVYTHLPSL